MQPPLTAGGSRRLLKRLRDLMAGGGSGQDRLDQVVKFIAAELVAEVCSIYIMRAGEVLELFATQGLKQEAVHRTRLRGRRRHRRRHRRPRPAAGAGRRAGAPEFRRTARKPARRSTTR